VWPSPDPHVTLSHIADARVRKLLSPPAATFGVAAVCSNSNFRAGLDSTCGAMETMAVLRALLGAFRHMSEETLGKVVTTVTEAY
jgi:hypothetical protein